MRLLISSDLHLEVWRERAPGFDTLTSKPDVVILAGDIHTRSRAPAWAAKTFPSIPVLYIAGNHEFYGEAIERAGESIHRECKMYPNVHYLDCSELFINGIRFLGATLWTDFSLFGLHRKLNSMAEARLILNDYRRIKVELEGYRKLHPLDTAVFHAKQKNWLEQKLGEAFSGCTVVITHMAPSIRSIPSEYAADLVSAAFASNLDHLVAKADVWVHGHTHSSFDYYIGKCRVVANPLGYLMRNGMPENVGFDKNFIVDLNHPHSL
jgi:predicted phosphodiesterase